jgi:phosphoglycolate phosphatase
MSPSRRAAGAGSPRQPAPRLRAVLWDLDGTLTDSVRLVVDTMNAVISAHGGPLMAYELLGAMTGMPLDAMFRMAWPDLAEDDVARYRAEYREIYDREAIPATRLFRGARATLRAFHAAGFLQATVTGKRAADCERILRGLGLRRDIDVYLGGDSVARPKPAPDLALRAIERLGVGPEEAVVVGDSAADIAMGSAAGAHTIQVLWGYEREPLAGAERVVRTWHELREAVYALAGRPPAILRRRGPLRS